MTLFLMAMLFGDMVPIKVHIDDPVPQIEMTSLSDGSVVQLPDVLEDGFVFFLAPTCGYCQEGMTNLRIWQEEKNVVFIYVGEKEGVLSFIEEHQGDLGNSFLVDHQQLKPWGLVTFPAALSFKDGLNRIAFHGPLEMNDLRLIQGITDGTVTFVKKEP